MLEIPLLLGIFLNCFGGGLCLGSGLLCSRLCFLCVDLLEREVDRHTQNDHAKRPELRGRKTRNERAAIVAAEHLVKEAEDAVRDEIKTHVVLEILLKEQIGKDTEEDKEECRLVELRGVNLVQKSGELHTEEGIGHFAVAAGGAKAAESAKGMRDGDDTGNHREDIGHPRGQTGAENEINDEEECRAADETADKGHARIHTDVEAVFGIFEEVIKGLEQDSGADADSDGRDAVKEQEIDEFFVKSELFAIDGEDNKARENTEREHNAVHVDIEEDGVWEHTITSNRFSTYSIVAHFRALFKRFLRKGSKKRFFFGFFW